MKEAGYNMCVCSDIQNLIAGSMIVTQLDAESRAKTKINVLPDLMELLV